MECEGVSTTSKKDAPQGKGKWKIEACVERERFIYFFSRT